MKIHLTKIPALAALSLFSILSSAWAQEGPPPPPSANVTTFATGLNYPRGLRFGPDGNLYVSEAGAGGTMSTSGTCDQVVPPVGPYTGGFNSRISRITPAGVRTTVADNLPSAVNAMGDVSGINDLAFIDDTLYALSSGGGCSHGFSGTPAAVLAVNVDGTTTQVADVSAFLHANPVANPFAGDFEPDGSLYSMIAVGDALFFIEPNHGELDMVTTTGTITRIADISATQGHIVPTVMAYDGNFYLGNLQGFPPSAPSEILKITPAGVVSVFATGFSEILGIAFDAAHRLYVLESSTGGDFPNPGTGKVVRLDGSDVTEIATGLDLPTGMIFGPDGNLYVSNWGFGPPNMGEIVKITVNSEPTKLGNVSSRGFVQSGDNVMIAGFILTGGNATTDVLIRALGPSLGSAGVHGTLADPTLDLRNANGVRVAFNDNWEDNAAQATLISATGLQPHDAHEAAIVATLAAGPHTAIVAGKNGETGVALVEVYNLK